VCHVGLRLKQRSKLMYAQDVTSKVGEIRAGQAPQQLTFGWLT
jgi:hypothetical protein